MTNPYQPPQESSDNRLVGLLVPGAYFGGYWGVTALGVLGGLSVGLIIYSEAWLRYIPTPFIAPAVGWVGAFAVLLLMLRGSEIQASTIMLLPLLLAIPAYILYVPVCTFTAMFTTPLLGSDGYGPTFPGLILSSVFAFVVILLLFAAILRRRFKRRVQPDDLEIVSAGQQTDFSAPWDGPLDE